MEEQKEKKKKGSVVVTVILCIVAVAAIIGVVVVMSTPSKPVKEAIKESKEEATKDGNAYYKDGEYELAIEKYEAQIEEDATNLSAYVGEAKSYDALGDLDNARRVLLNAIDANPDDEYISDIYLLYADYCVKADDDFEAYEFLTNYGLIDSYSNSNFTMPDTEPHFDEDGYFIYGQYPTYKIADERVNDTIKNADFDDNGFATVYGIKIARVVKNDVTTYYGFDQIKWKVIEVDEHEYTLQTLEAIDNTPFNDTYESVYYMDSTLRTWLNGTFLENAGISTDDILDMTVNPTHNPDYSNTWRGDYLEDKCTILSIDEVADGENGYPEDRKSESQARQCGATEYAEGKGVFVTTDGYCKWMLRSNGREFDTFAFVGELGIISCDGYYVNSDNVGVRPVIKVTYEE